MLICVILRTAISTGKTNPIYSVVASGEAGTKPISEAKASAFYGYFSAKEMYNRSIIESMS
jgi:hypothetical protein